MLLPESLRPTAGATGVPYSTLELGALLMHLRVLSERAILVVDEDGDLHRAMADFVNSWPPQYQKFVRAVLTDMSKRKRLLGLPVNLGCEIPGDACELALLVADQWNVDFIISPGICSCPCERCACDHPIARDVHELIYEPIRSLASGAIDVNGWERARFETEILDPIVRLSRRVLILDRWIGRSMFRRGHVKLQGSYAGVLEWIVYRFSRMSFAADGVTIVTEIPSELDGGVLIAEESMLEGAAGLRGFGKRLQNTYGVEVDFDLRVSSGHASHMQHDRFLRTDQVCLFLGRGFDFVRPDSTLKDSVVGVMNEDSWRKLWKATSRLPKFDQYRFSDHVRALHRAE